MISFSLNLKLLKWDKNYKKKIKKNQTIAYTASFLIVVFFSFFIVKDFIIHNNNLHKLEKSYQLYSNKKSKIVPSDDFSHVLEVLNDFERIKQFNLKNTSNDFWKLLFYKVDFRQKKMEELYLQRLEIFIITKNKHST